MSKPSGNDDLLTRSEAAAELRLTVKCMDNWRCAGRGPTFLKLGGRVVYPRSEIEAFKAAARRTSTLTPAPSRLSAA
jgi:hypothetical protein